MKPVRKAGFVLITVAVSLVALLGVAGLAVDVGRIYIAKHELQTFVDAAALGATMELDGTAGGIERAKSVLTGGWNKWNLHTQQVQGATIAFAKDKTGPWESYITSPSGYRYARVNATETLQTYFLPGALSLGSKAPPVAMLLAANPGVAVRANSAAGQEMRTSFREGLFPFSPYAHDPNAPPHFGLVLGQKYTLRWAATPKLNQNTCAGDNNEALIALATAGGGEERGFIESTSSDLIRATIEQDYQTVTRTIGDAVTMTGGTKQTQVTSLHNRIRQDTDPDSASFAAYVLKSTGNGRRIVAVPINTGSPSYRIVQIGAFFLLPTSEYPNGGNKAFCAEYVGAWLQGSTRQGAADSGAYVAQLIRQ